ncbi:hypothetical protein B0H66DRAFT_552905 [Apodospora peruviana]|uniref:Glyoxalase family protein n=1 Tax=Apodospora peruviana TaxID=516989 RepID=A0AAE0IB87_9PEZI|nr:hypothetical protein B0H66DRAFT_552905 [Apodospora peruviana]
MITGLHHVNIIVPKDTLPLAREFYGTTLGLTPRPVPQLQRDSLSWFDIASSGQQLHVAFGRDEDFTPSARQAPRHPCFRLESVEKLNELQRRIWKHFLEGQQQSKIAGADDGSSENVRAEAAPMQCDEPGGENSGDKGVEYPTRFFARDYAGNRLEFTV